ncbi:MAG TPA: phosphoribosylanthranilate isomerase [Microvirga sp.]|jgi:phosphoribosylanthranilate isomerase|nr:phosphoribosylanthranilate isomerase [Microvirga sp.]
MSLVKICGLSTPETLEAALGAGADLVGFVHFPRSPRHIALEPGRALAAGVRGRALKVALLVDPDDATLDAVVAALDPDLIQLHGTESPGRVAAIRARTGRPVMKAVGIAERADLAALERYRGAADRILLDAKPPKSAGALPGGNGIAFDWRLVAGLDAGGLDPATSFMLSGGLTPDNVGTAIALTGARSVDVSSGVEVRPGEKDPARIEAFVKAARAAWAAPPQG